MDNPFTSLKTKPLETLIDENGGILTEQQRREKRDALYNAYTPTVYAVLDQLIAACMPAAWTRGSDCIRLYCCHISWYAGPLEKHHDPYDVNHDIRRMIEVVLELDGMCEPTGFKVIRHANPDKTVHVALTREALIDGIQTVFA